MAAHASITAGVVPVTVAGTRRVRHARAMTRVDLKGERPDDATETRTMAEQDRHVDPVDLSTRTFVILLLVILAGFGGLALFLRG